MKVEMIEPVGGHGGMDYYDFGLCGGLAAAGAEVSLYTCDETRIQSQLDFSIKRIYHGIYGDKPVWLRGLRYARGSIFAIFEAVFSGVQICHFHFFQVGIMEAFNVALAKMLGLRVVATAHDVEPFAEGLSVPWLVCWVYGVVDSVIAHNEISKQELVKKLKVSEAKISVIPHGNYLHMIPAMPSREEARRRLGISENAKVVLFFGQIKRIKGLDVLIDAMPGVLRVFPETVLLIAGKTWKTDFAAYEEQMQHWGILGKSIAHIRYIPDEETPNYYAACDVVVLPYRRIYQSGVALMAMSYGKPVVASDIPGMKEIFAGEDAGFMFRAGDSKDLTDVLVAAFSDKERLSGVAYRGYEMAQKKHNWAEIGRRTAEVYARLGQDT